MPVFACLLCVLFLGAQAIASERSKTPDAPGFLHQQAASLKVRWRSHYLAKPPAPSTDRQRTAFSVGLLLAEAELILQTQDAQQFRNITQELIAACRALGLSEAIMPRLMTQAQMAQQNAWEQLLPDLRACCDHLLGLLRQQRDSDLALFVESGHWLRLLEICLAPLRTDAPDEATSRLLRLAAKQATSGVVSSIKSLSAGAAGSPLGRQLRSLATRLEPLDQASAVLAVGIDEALRASDAAALPGGATPR